MKKFIILAGVVLLTGCGGEEQGELRQELAAMTKDLRGKVDPLPQVRSYEPVPYKGESMLDPFVPGRIVRTFPELVDAIRRDDYEVDKVAAFARTHFAHLDAGSSDRVIDQLVLGR